jgi:hypothetical protein
MELQSGVAESRSSALPNRFEAAQRTQLGDVPFMATQAGTKRKTGISGRTLNRTRKR